MFHLCDIADMKYLVDNVRKNRIDYAANTNHIHMTRNHSLTKKKKKKSGSIRLSLSFILSFILLFLFFLPAIWKQGVRDGAEAVAQKSLRVLLLSSAEAD
jgi:hypothetical protein